MRGHGLEELLAIDRLHDRAADGRHERVAVEGAALVAVLEAARAGGGQERGERDARAQPFAERHDVGIDPRVLVAEEPPGAADAGLDLVEDQQHVVAARERT